MKHKCILEELQALTRMRLLPPLEFNQGHLRHSSLKRTLHAWMGYTLGYVLPK